MKKILRNNRLIVFAFMTLFQISSASGRDLNPAPTGLPGPGPVELKFIGLIKNHPVFQLNVLGSTEQDECTIIIKDDEGNILYKENIIGKSFSKKFLINTDEIGDDDLRFEIYSKTSGDMRSFDVNANSRLVQQWGLAKSN